MSGSVVFFLMSGRGLDDARTPPEVLAEAADCALIAARYVAAPRTGPENHAPQPMPAL